MSAIEETPAIETTFLEAIREAMLEEMQRDERVFLIGEDVGVYGGAFKTSAGLQETFGKMRVIDTPISETAIIGAAAGAALTGMRPIAEMQFIDFITCAYDAIVNFVSKSRYRGNGGVPMVIRGPAGGGMTAGPFHSGNPEAWFLNIPGLKIVYPSTAYDAKGLLKAAIRDEDPVIFIEHKFLYRRVKEVLPKEDFIVPIGKAAVRREGKDLSIITWGAMTWVALEAAEALEAENVSVEVVDMRTISPVDEETMLASVKKTSRALVLYEAPLTGGAGGELVARIADKAFEYLDAPVKRVASLDTPVPYSPPLEEFYRPNKDKVLAAARELLRY